MRYFLWLGPLKTKRTESLLRRSRAWPGPGLGGGFGFCFAHLGSGAIFLGLGGEGELGGKYIKKKRIPTKEVQAFTSGSFDFLGVSLIRLVFLLILLILYDLW